MPVLNIFSVLSFTVSPHANQSPMKKPPKSCPVFQLAGDFDSDTSNGTARIRFPRTQSPSTSAPPGVQREKNYEGLQYGTHSYAKSFIPCSHELDD
ncbi:hypothetical protein E5288_WYG000627 [Bos mutus]|uniref:Uncharacterized protein n=1 Tax=Bos mutus TaxID=72004 RepID=A0A6B0QQ63_9CETA|nr:hypothetical protein [Bos mutus]